MLEIILSKIKIHIMYGPDKLKWGHTPINVFTIKEAYFFLIADALPPRI